MRKKILAFSLYLLYVPVNDENFFWMLEKFKFVYQVLCEVNGIQIWTFQMMTY